MLCWRRGGCTFAVFEVAGKFEFARRGHIVNKNEVVIFVCGVLRLLVGLCLQGRFVEYEMFKQENEGQMDGLMDRQYARTCI